MGIIEESLILVTTTAARIHNLTHRLLQQAYMPPLTHDAASTKMLIIDKIHTYSGK